MTDITNGPGRHYILLEVETRKGVASLADKVAGRAWTLEGVVKTQAWALDSHDAYRLATAEADARLTLPVRGEVNCG